MYYLKKFFRDLRAIGISATAAKTFHFVLFRTKLKLTSVILKIKIGKMNEIAVKHGNYKLNFHNDGDGNELLYHTFWKKYFTNEKKQLETYVKEGDTVIDAGANLGIFTLILSELVGKNGKVYSFEPSKKIFNKLNQTIQLNKLTNVEAFNLGLGNEEKKDSLFYNPEQTGLSTMIEDESETTITEEIGITTLDNFSEKIKDRISLIKIDTEGYEPEVLLGAINVIKKDLPVIYIELGGEHQDSSSEALNLLNELNYECDAFEIDLKKVPSGTNFIAKLRNLD